MGGCAMITIHGTASLFQFLRTVIYMAVIPTGHF